MRRCAAPPDLILLVVAEVILFLIASVASEESPTHPSTGTVSDLFSWLFWIGAVVLIAIGVRRLFRRAFFRRFIDTYVHTTPGLAEGGRPCR